MSKRAITDEALHAKVLAETLRRQIAIERKYLIKDLGAITHHLEEIGETRAGLLKRGMARRYHTTVARLRAIVGDLAKGEGLS